MNPPDRHRRAYTAATLLWLAAPAVRAAGLELHGAGATFPAPVYAGWSTTHARETGVTLTYDPVGSGAGTELLARRQVDFAATDIPLAPRELQAMRALQFPVVVGGVVPVLNADGIGSGRLRLDGATLTAIYLGQVRKWNDDAIAALNPGLDLPSEYITVVHREEASGTTGLWSEFLARSSPAWRERVGTGTLPRWPTGVARAGNDGVAAMVQRTRASIGYVEYAYAKLRSLNVAALRNRDGGTVVPERGAFEAAALAAPWARDADLDQLLVDRRSPQAWPITGTSFIVVPLSDADPARTRAVLGFFDGLLARGQSTVEGLDYAPLPPAALALVKQRWAARGLAPLP